MVSPLRPSSPLLLLCGLSVGLLAPMEAAADKVSNAMAECQGKIEGEACALAGRKGACVARSFERPNGMSKRWVECSPGKKPDRKASDRKIDATGPVGVLPSVGSVEGDPPVEAPVGAPVEPKDVGSAGTPPPSDIKVEAAEEGSEPSPSAMDKVQPEPEAAPAEAPSPTADRGEDRSAAPAREESETRGGCRLDVSPRPLGAVLGLAGLLLIAGRRREARTKQK